MVKYDKVTVHLEGETGPMVVRGVAELAKSHFPESGPTRCRERKSPAARNDETTKIDVFQRERGWSIDEGTPL